MVYRYLRHGFKRAIIRRIIDENYYIKSFYLDVNLPKIPKPGQFLMIMPPNGEEIPISVSGHIDGLIRLTIARVGYTTNLMHKLSINNIILVRGPYGNGFKLNNDKKYLLVGGGYGVAPLIYIAEQLYGKTILLLGVRSKRDIILIDEAQKYCGKVFISSEDGSIGFKGTVIDLLEKLVLTEDFDEIITCGPEKMMYKVMLIAERYGKDFQASLERLMKCGFGICGSCILDPLGLRVCVDGPVFDLKILRKTDFGKYFRDEYGRRVELK